MDNIKTEQEFLSLYQFAGLLDVSNSTVTYWIKTGALVPAARTPNGRNLFTRDQVDKILTLKAKGEWPAPPIIRGEALFSAKVVAGALGIHPKTVHTWAKEGRLIPRSRTPGGRARYSQAQIDELLAAKAEGRLPPPRPGNGNPDGVA